MIKTSSLTKTFAAATLLVAGSSVARAEEPASFVHAGTTYTYVQTVDHGRRVLTGRTSSGERFRLVVGERAVSGTFNGAPVRFGLNEVARINVAMR